MKKLAIGLGLVLLGALLTVVGFYIWLEMRARDTRTAEDIRKEYLVEYTKSEQRKQGIDCHKLKPQLRSFLESKLGPVISRREAGKSWTSLVSEDLKREVTWHRQFVFACLRLYEAGDSGRRNGMEHLDFADEVNKDMIVMDILVRLGPGQKCEGSCADGKFRELRAAYERVLQRLK